MLRGSGGAGAAARGSGGGGAVELEREWRGMEGDLAREREGVIGQRAGYPAIEGGMLVMAHHRGVRHKNTHSNGAPFSGAPLVTSSFHYFLLHLIICFFYQICYFHED